MRARCPAVFKINTTTNRHLNGNCVQSIRNIWTHTHLSNNICRFSILHQFHQPRTTVSQQQTATVNNKQYFNTKTESESSDIEYDSDEDEIESDEDAIEAKPLSKSEEIVINFRKYHYTHFEPTANPEQAFSFSPLPRLPGPSPFVNPEYKRHSKYDSLEILKLPLSSTMPLSHQSSNGSANGNGQQPQAWIFNSNNERKSICNLSPDVFNQGIRIDLLYRSTKFEHDKELGFTWHIVRHRGEIHGSHRKRRPQKYTGRARMSDGKAPQFKGGGHAHGRRPRDMTTTLHDELHEQGFKVALSARYLEGDLLIWEDYVLPPLSRPSDIDWHAINKHKEIPTLIPVQQLDHNQNTSLSADVQRCRQMLKRFHWLKPGVHERINSKQQFEKIYAAKKTGNIVDIFESMPVSDFEWDFLREEDELEDVSITTVLMVHTGYVHSHFRQQIARIKGIDLVTVDELFDCLGVFRLLKYKKIVLNIPALQAITDRIGAENEISRWNFFAKLNAIKQDENCKPAFSEN